jgi:hypothetical protein
MGTTTFSGPIKAGTIQNTTGTTAGTDVANVGQVVMVQSCSVTQDSSDTTIVIPSNSQIIRVHLIVSTTIWNGSATTMGVQDALSAAAITNATGMDGGTARTLVEGSPSGTGTSWNRWVDTGALDRKLALVSTNTGAGEGTLAVSYIQNNNIDTTS